LQNRRPSISCEACAHQYIVGIGISEAICI
jgi:hypothetical protein